MDVLMSEEQRMITQAVKRFVREEVQPLERDLDPDAVELPPGELDRLKGIVQQMGLVPHRRARGLRRSRYGAYHAWSGGRGDVAASGGLVPALLRGLRLSRTGTALRRHRRPEGPLPLSDAQRREASLLRSDRALGRIGPGARDSDESGQGRRRLDPERVEALQLGR